jgi:hypothetical protein
LQPDELDFPWHSFWNFSVPGDPI